MGSKITSTIPMGVCRIVASILIVAIAVLAAGEEVVPLNEDTVVLLDDGGNGPTMSLSAMRAAVAEGETKLDEAKATVAAATTVVAAETQKKTDAVKEAAAEVAEAKSVTAPSPDEAAAALDAANKKKKA